MVRRYEGTKVRMKNSLRISNLVFSFSSNFSATFQQKFHVALLTVNCYFNFKSTFYYV